MDEGKSQNGHKFVGACTGGTSTPPLTHGELGGATLHMYCIPKQSKMYTEQSTVKEFGELVVGGAETQ